MPATFCLQIGHSTNTTPWDPKRLFWEVPFFSPKCSLKGTSTNCLLWSVGLSCSTIQYLEVAGQYASCKSPFKWMLRRPFVQRPLKFTLRTCLWCGSMLIWMVWDCSWKSSSGWATSSHKLGFPFDIFSVLVWLGSEHLCCQQTHDT